MSIDWNMKNLKKMVAILQNLTFIGPVNFVHVRFQFAPVNLLTLEILIG